MPQVTASRLDGPPTWLPRSLLVADLALLKRPFAYAPRSDLRRTRAPVLSTEACHSTSIRANALRSAEGRVNRKWQHVQGPHVALGLAANVAAADLSLGLVECALGLLEGLCNNCREFALTSEVCQSGLQSTVATPLGPSSFA